jgi:hypothetical protein
MQVGSDDPVMFKNERALGAGQLDAPSEAGVDGCRRLQRAEGPAAEFERGDDRVLHLDVVERRDGPGVDALDIAHQPQQQVDCVHPLIHQCPAAVQGPRAAPARAAVILRRAIPLHSTRY